jgi:hypothetical protein
MKGYIGNLVEVDRFAREFLFSEEQARHQTYVIAIQICRRLYQRWVRILLRPPVANAY